MIMIKMMIMVMIVMMMIIIMMTMLNMFACEVKCADDNDNDYYGDEDPK